MSRKHAFTLIELLVVIAIIAILAAILFPVFAQAREKARQATCVSNMKNIALADLMYAQDYDEIGAPSWVVYNGAPASYRAPFTGIAWGGYWPDEIYPYVKNGTAGTAHQRAKSKRGIFACPTTNNILPDLADVGWGGAAGWGSLTYGLTQAYVHNDPVNLEGGGPGSGYENCGFPSPQDWGGGCAKGHPLARIGHPGSSILFAEGDVLVGAFFNMDYTVGSYGKDNVKNTDQAYPPDGYKGTKKQHHSPNTIAWLSSGSNIAWDSTTDDEGAGGPNGPPWGDCGVPGCTDRTIHLHTGVGNYAFADGHVKARRATTLAEWTASSD